MAKLRSVGLFCGSASGVDPAHERLAGAFGLAVAQAGLRLVYGGGGIGLMGAAARAAHAAGGAVLGVIPDFLMSPEIAFEDADLEVVTTLHERKRRMAEASDGFVVLPGGVGTLEEAVEILSWARLDRHSKKIVFLDTTGYWDPFFTVLEQQVREAFSPADIWRYTLRARSPGEALERLAPTPAEG